MGERKGQNFYYPPDFDYRKHGNLNRYHGTHALRERASKVHLGILVIRFEMPFNVWCEGCGNHIGMGVRYNAEKKKVGMYYTTPVYEFRMKCHLCDTYFDIRTDPKNFEYELVSGLKRQDKRPINVDGQIQRDREASQKMATDAMYKLEHGESDKARTQEAAPRMELLERVQGRMYDDYTMNQAARKIFRTKKKVINAQKAVDSALVEKSSLGDLELVEESSEDRKLASMITKYKTIQDSEETQQEKRYSINSRSIFEKPTTSNGKSPSSSNSVVPAKKFKKADRLEQLRKSLALNVSSKKKAANGFSSFSSGRDNFASEKDQSIGAEREIVPQKADEIVAETTTAATKESTSVKQDYLSALGEMYGSSSSDSDSGGET